MKFLSFILLISFFIISTSCTKDDNNDPDCVKDENYFNAEFDGEILEPIWKSIGFGSKVYSFSIYRHPENQNNWKLMVGTQDPGKTLYIYMKDIDGIGVYPIETKTEEDISMSFLKTYIYITDESYIGDPNLSTLTHFSLGETGTIEITDYDTDVGIMVGTFNCTMYSTHEDEGKVISGEFNINLSTHNKNEKPCWL